MASKEENLKTVALQFLAYMEEYLTKEEYSEVLRIIVVNPQENNRELLRLQNEKQLKYITFLTPLHRGDLSNDEGLGELTEEFLIKFNLFLEKFISECKGIKEKINEPVKVLFLDLPDNPPFTTHLLSKNGISFRTYWGAMSIDVPVVIVDIVYAILNDKESEKDV